MAGKIGVAGVQMYVWAGEIEKNFQNMKNSIQYISKTYPFVEMIVFSELALYGVPFAGWKKAAGPVPGPMTDRFCTLAAKYNKWLIPGTFYEKEGADIYNTAVAISPQGKIVGKYRKLFPWQPLEETKPGKDYCVFEVPGVGRFGLSICYDMWFPETIRTLTWMGAEVILHPTMTTTADRAQEQILARANAITNQLYFIDVNGTGFGGIGQSLFVDPHGRVLQSTLGEAMIMVEIIDLDLVNSVRTYGTAGVSQVLKQLKAFPHKFPPYENGIGLGAGFKNLETIKRIK